MTDVKYIPFLKLNRILNISKDRRKMKDILEVVENNSDDLHKSVEEMKVLLSIFQKNSFVLVLVPNSFVLLEIIFFISQPMRLEAILKKTKIGPSSSRCNHEHNWLYQSCWMFTVPVPTVLI